jgi:histone demethylase JARID1
MEVQAHGGFHYVTESRKWSVIGRVLGLLSSTVTATTLKSCYSKILLPFDEYLSGSDVSEEEGLLELSQVLLTDGSQNVARDLLGEGDMKTDQKKDHHEEEFESKMSARGIKSSQAGYRVPPEASLPRIPLPADYHPRSSPETLCESCGRGHSPELLLRCAQCSRASHPFCLDPPISSHPKLVHSWKCANCTSFKKNMGGYIGLTEIMTKSNELKCNWFRERAHGTAEIHGLTPGNKKIYVTEDQVENEFWRILGSSFECIQLTVGKHLSSSTHGSGFANSERDASNPYAKDPFNLNVLPWLDSCLLSTSSCESIIQPRLDIGMVFAPVPWQSQIHECYSISYLHCGDTQTWYSVPASDAVKLNQYLRLKRIQSSEGNDDELPFVSPDELIASGVHVAGCHQRAGEFVVTFPRSYQAGFSHGFNILEGVNFASVDWLNPGLECAKRYQSQKINPMFSFDEVLFQSAIKLRHEMASAICLLPHLRLLVERCKADIQAISDDSPAQFMDPSALCDVQCKECLIFCWFSHVYCEVENATYCVHHSCACKGRVLNQRYDIETVVRVVTQIEETAMVPSEWISNFRSKCLQHSVAGSKPSFKELSDMLQSADRIPCIIEDAVHLRTHLQHVLEWVESAGKHCKKRVGKKFSYASPVSIELVERLYNEGVLLHVDVPELNSLYDIMEQVQRLNSHGSELVSRSRPTSIEECRNYLEACARVELELPIVQGVRDLVKELEWRKKALSGEADNFSMLLELLDEGYQLGIESQDELFSVLREKKARGETWNMRAGEVLAMDNLNISGTLSHPLVIVKLLFAKIILMQLL